MKVIVAGQGAFGQQHIRALKNIEGVEIVSLVGSSPETAKAVAEQYGVAHYTADLAESLAQPGVECAILATPTQMHADQTIQCLKAGKHVQVEIPMSDTLADAERVALVREQTGLIAMAGHTRRFNPSHQWVHKKIVAGELKLQQLVVQTFFFRRTNKNALGQARSWTDHLLWHHACHTVDLFAYQSQGDITKARALEGPHHPDLGIAMDMSIQLKSSSNAICTLALSFNNEGPLGTFFRYICDNGTYIARYDDLFDGADSQIDVSKVDVSMNGIELQDREFIAAIKEGREPNASVQQVLPCMRTLDRLEKSLSQA